MFVSFRGRIVDFVNVVCNIKFLLWGCFLFLCLFSVGMLGYKHFVEKILNKVSLCISFFCIFAPIYLAMKFGLVGVAYCD